MTNLREIIYQETFLFDLNGLKPYQVNLNLILSFLKKYDRENSKNFTYSDGLSSFHNNLSLKENLHLDVLPLSFNTDQEKQLINFLKRVKNPYLLELLKGFNDLNLHPEQVSSEERQLFSIAKALLADKKYLCLVKPEMTLSPAKLEHVKKAIQFEADQSKKSIIIATSNKLVWFSLATKLIVTNDTKKFQVLGKLKKAESKKPTIELVDQAA